MKRPHLYKIAVAYGPAWRGYWPCKPGHGGRVYPSKRWAERKVRKLRDVHTHHTFDVEVYR